MHFENWFIRDEKLLQETSNSKDLLYWDSYISKYSDRIDEFHWSNIRWLIGHFWIWKSTLINNMRNHRKDSKKNERWFEFDARKYPDRKDLWEWFVLDFAKQVSEKKFNDAKKHIDWNKNEDKKTLANVAWVAASLFIPWWNVISNLSYFFNTSPAKRVFEIQEIFWNLVGNLKENKIIIVVEDIDRSWDAWIFFLETLKQFISKNDFWKEILIIIPIWTNEYYDNIDSYLKPIDYFDFFTPINPNLEWFIQEIFIDDIINDKRYFQPLKEFLEWLFDYYPNEINIRKLKMIIRKANQNHIMMYGKYDELFDLDRRLNIIFEVIKYIDFNDKKESLFSRCEDEWFGNNSLILAYLYNLIWNVDYKRLREYYNWDSATLFKLMFDEFKRKEQPVLNESPSIQFKFWLQITEKWIIWWWYGWDFKNELKNFVIPEEYLNY